MRIKDFFIAFTYLFKNSKDPFKFYNKDTKETIDIRSFLNLSKSEYETLYKMLKNPSCDEELTLKLKIKKIYYFNYMQQLRD